MSQLRSNNWMWLSAGVLTGGLVVKYVGFRTQIDPSGNGFKNFAKTVCYYKLGVLTSVVSMCLIKLTKIPEYVWAYPKTAFLITIFGMYKLEAHLAALEQPAKRLNFIISSLLFHALPSLNFSKYSNDILVKTLCCTIMVVTVCFVAGTIIPMENNRFILNSFGFEISRIGIVIVTVSALDRLVFSDNKQLFPKYVIHLGATLVVSGVLTDDVQQVKNKFLESAEEEEEPLRSIVFKSITFFVESALIFGRIAHIYYYVLETRSYN